jgi:hypothetical protein
LINPAATLRTVAEVIRNAYQLSFVKLAQRKRLECFIVGMVGRFLDHDKPG